MLTYIECGRIINTHGVRGEVKIEPWCDSPEVFLTFREVYMEKNGIYRKVGIKSRLGGKHLIASLEGVEDMDTAIVLKGVTLYVHRDAIPVPEGEMLLCDMIGLPVVDATSGVTYGILSRIEDGAASTLYYVKTEKGEVILPAVPAFIKEVSPDGVKVTPISGFFDEV